MTSKRPIASRGLGLGHRRLKIMDLEEASGQPMVDAEAGLSLVFSGGPYDYHLTRHLQSLCQRDEIPVRREP